MAINSPTIKSPTLPVNEWVKLPAEVRAKFISHFKIPRSGVGHINYTGQGAIVTSDGHTYEDLKAVTIKEMQRLLKSKETDYYTLLNSVIEKFNVQEETK